MNTKEETKSSQNLYYRAVNSFTVKAATAMYFVSTLAILL